MARLRKQDQDDDYIFGTKDEFFINTPLLTGQLSKTRLKLWAGEFGLDLSEGTRYKIVFGAKNEEIANDIVRPRLQNTPTLDEIVFFEPVLNNRNLNIFARIKTVFRGQTVNLALESVLPVNNNADIPVFVVQPVGTFGANGLTIKNASEIYNELVANAQEIFGADVITDPSTQDMQYIFVFSLALADALQILEQVNNAFSPATAIGTSLDQVVLLNGITRKTGTQSTADLDIVGVEGTTITNGFALDVNGNRWELPTPVVIPASGTITVVGTCETIGAIEATAGAINAIATPQLGWSSVNNPSDAIVGSELETDEQLRERQRISTEMPAVGPVQSLTASLLQIDGVSRVRVYNNDTNATDSNGIPAHSIAAIVEGGDNQDIADTIYAKKGMGCGMFGAISVLVIDPYGFSQDYVFDRPIIQQIYIDVDIEAFPNFNASLIDTIKNNLVAYVDGLDIGSDIYVNNIAGIVNDSDFDLDNPSFEVLQTSIGFSPPPTTTSGKITLDFNGVPQVQVSNINVNIIP